MPYQTFPLTPEFAVEETAVYRAFETRFESGDVQTRTRWPRPKRTWRLNWHHASTVEAETMRSFARDHRGNADFFYFTTPEKVTRPYAGPAVGTIAGGALDARTVWVKYCWMGTNSAYRTTPSNPRTCTVPANCIVSVRIPNFPANVPYAMIYCSSNGTTWHGQSTLAAAGNPTWLELTTGWVATGISPTTTNTLSELALVHLSQNSLDITKSFINDYQMVCDFEEVFGV